MATNKVEVEIAAKATGFSTEFAKLTSQAKTASDRIKSAFGGVQTALAGLGVGLSVAGFTAFVKGAVDAADKLNDLAKATGVSATTIGGIGFAAAQAGTDLEGVAKAFGKLNLQIADAQAGNAQTVETFRKLGVSLADLKGLNSEQIFAKLADTFATYEDDANKAAAANALFGKSYQSILPLLDQGGEELRKNIGYYERYSGVTADLVVASDQFNDSLTKLQLLNRAFANHLAAALLPSLQSFVDYMVQAKESSTGFKEAAGDMAESLKYLVKFAVAGAFAFRDFGQFIGSFAAQAKALKDLNFKAIADIGDDSDARMERSKQQLLEIKGIIDKISTGPSQDGFHRSPIPLGGFGKKRKAPNFGNAGARAGDGAAKSKVDEFARALERVSKLAADADLELAGMFSTQEITGAQKALATLTSSDEWKKFTAPQQAELTARLQAIDAIQRETAEWKRKNEEQEKSIRLFEEQQQQQQQAVGAFTATLGDYAEQNTFLERSIALVGKDDVARQKLAETIEYERLVRQALLADDDPAAAAARIALLETEFNKRIQLIEMLADASARFQEVQQYNQIFADNFASAVTDVVNGTKSISDAFKDMAKSIADAITRIAAQKLAESIFNSSGIGNIFSGLFGGGGGFDLGKLIGGLFGGGGGGDILTGLQGFATGGNPPVGRFSLVGERGPELIYPRSPMTVVPINRAASGGGTDRATVTQTINVLPGASYQTARQAAKLAADRATFARRRG